MQVALWSWIAQQSAKSQRWKEEIHTKSLVSQAPLILKWASSDFQSDSFVAVCLSVSLNYTAFSLLHNLSSLLPKVEHYIFIQSAKVGSWACLRLLNSSLGSFANSSILDIPWPGWLRISTDKSLYLVCSCLSMWRIISHPRERVSSKCSTLEHTERNRAKSKLCNWILRGWLGIADLAVIKTTPFTLVLHHNYSKTAD